MMLQIEAKGAETALSHTHDAAQSKACCAQEACLQGAFGRSIDQESRALGTLLRRKARIQVARGKAKAAKATEERARPEVCEEPHGTTFGAPDFAKCAKRLETRELSLQGR